jgi:hypothetical protein
MEQLIKILFCHKIALRLKMRGFSLIEFTRLLFPTLIEVDLFECVHQLRNRQVLLVSLLGVVR